MADDTPGYIYSCEFTRFVYMLGTVILILALNNMLYTNITRNTCVCGRIYPGMSFLGRRLLLHVCMYAAEYYVTV